MCGDVFSVPAGNIPQLDPICVVRAVLPVLAGPSHHHWLERYDEFLLGLFGGSGNGKCWFILKLFASLCIQLQSRRDVYHSPASQPATDYEEISNKTLWFPNQHQCQLQLLVLMNKNLMSDSTDIFK